MVNSKFSLRLEANVDPAKRLSVYPKNIRIVYDSVIVDTSSRGGIQFPAIPAKFSVYVLEEDNSMKKVPFTFKDSDGDRTFGGHTESVVILDTTVTPRKNVWTITIDTTDQYLRGALRKPTRGDVYQIGLTLPLTNTDEFTFTTTAQHIDGTKAKTDFALQPYVVPNPYVGAASFEPERFAISGRGDRRIEFRGLPANCIVRIYTVTGDLVQTLRHEGSNDGLVAWNLRTKDNMDVAPGLYIFHVDGKEVGTHVGKFAIIK
jgi:hypothetical protein